MHESRDRGNRFPETPKSSFILIVIVSVLSQYVFHFIKSLNLLFMLKLVYKIFSCQSVSCMNKGLNTGNLFKLFVYGSNGFYSIPQNY